MRKAGARLVEVRGATAAVLAGLLAGSCQAGSPAPSQGSGADWTPRPARDLGAEVARVGDRPIFAEEVAAQSARFGLTPQRALAQLVEFELLAERAREHGRAAPPPPLETSATSRPDEARRQLLVERLLEQEFEPGIRREDVPEADLRKLYEQNLPRFVHPRLVEVALLSVYTGPGMKPAPRARAEVTAHDLWDFVSKSPLRTAEAFAEIAKDKAWADRKVGYWHLIQGPDRNSGPFGANVGGALQKLHSKGETSPLIIDDSGFHIARYIDEKPPINVPFEKAREEILAGYHPVWRRQRFISWTTSLGSSHGVEVFDDRLLATGTPAAP